MKHVTRTAVGALAVLFTTVAVGEEPAGAKQAPGAVVALAASGRDARPQDAPIGLDRYTGRYDGARGAVFFVDRDGGSLTIEVPAELGGGTARLYGGGEHDAFATADGALIVFRSDATGHVTGLAFHAFDGKDAIDAEKAPAPRGIVTVYELPSSPAVVLAEAGERSGL